MNNIEHQIRLHVPDFPSDPEPKYPWRWKLYYGFPAGVIGLAVIGAGCLWRVFAG